MKKIGIITLNGNFNYGNRLQNYALQFYLQRMGFFVRTIWFINIKDFIIKYIKEHFLFSKKFLRIRIISKFTKAYINVDYVFSRKKLNDYDFFIVGSDQVWNYNYTSFNEDFLLSFSNKEKNISYSASFGTDRIPNQKKELFKRGMANINCISVREYTGVNIIKDLLPNKDVSVLIDPTLLLNRNEWGAIISHPKQNVKEKYVLCYFLGSDEQKKYITDYCNRKNLIIIDLLNINCKYYLSNPGEFLYFIDNSEFVCTDSFHACVFSFLFDKSFIVFKRRGKEENTYSRIDSLLTKFELKDRVFNGKAITDKNLKHDYTKAYMILEEERKKAKFFLEKALNITKVKGDE